MSADLQPVWHQIEYYLNNGISLLPVRDKDDAKGIAKTPFSPWKKYETEIITKDELFDLMDNKHNTTAVAIIGGKISGNLEIIDIDVKYKLGIDARLFSDIKDFYPDILKKVRIHKSPSTGYHIIYRCEATIPGSQKLAGRMATVEELKNNPKNKTYNFLETRGEASYVLAPPSLGYTVSQDNPIPTITEAERESLITLCKSYNEIIKVDAPYKPTTHDTNYYDTNPFDDFNYRCDPASLMSELGWHETKHNSQFIWFTRPGKSKGVSLSFNHQKRFFYCFTSSTELEENKGYTPCNILSLLKFNNDKKQLYTYLVAQGYGKIKPKVEQRLAKVAATNGQPLPKNISTEAIGIHAAIITEQDENHPHGIFWVDSAEHGILIDRELLYIVSDKLGFKLHNYTLVYSDKKYIEAVEDRVYFDAIKKYVQEEDADLHKDICNAYEAFIERHGRFTISRLQKLSDNDILKDTKDAAFKCYLNGVLQITSQSIQLLTSVPQLIWRKNLQLRNYNYNDAGRYVEFLNLAIDMVHNPTYLKRCIGYLAHEFKDETAGYIIVLVEQCENPEDGGGSGKNVFSELFKRITTFVSKPGSQVKFDEKFMQSWNHQKIFCISDVPKNFNFSFLKELSTGTGLMKKLFKDECEITSENMPKFLIQTNYSYETVDGGLKRRIKPIEFTRFFTDAGGIDVHFGVHFPNEWASDDWAGFDTFMADCIQQWLLGNRKIGSSILSESGWAKQFEQTWGQVISHFIAANFDSWVLDGKVSNDKFKGQLEAYYRDNNTPPTYHPSTIKINKAIKSYCTEKKIQYEYDLQHKVNNYPFRYKWFGKEDETPF